jgi:hypothetical protein
MSVIEKRIATIKYNDIIRQKNLRTIQQEEQNHLKNIIGDEFINDINKAINDAMENSELKMDRDAYGVYTIQVKAYPRIKTIPWKDAYRHFGTWVERYVTEKFTIYPLLVNKNDNIVFTQCEINGMSKMCNPMSLLNTFELALWGATFPLYGAYKMIEYNKHCSNGYIPVEITLSFRESFVAKKS